MAPKEQRMHVHGPGASLPRQGLGCLPPQVMTLGEPFRQACEKLSPVPSPRPHTSWPQPAGARLRAATRVTTRATSYAATAPNPQVRLLHKAHAQPPRKCSGRAPEVLPPPANKDGSGHQHGVAVSRHVQAPERGGSGRAGLRPVGRG